MKGHIVLHGITIIQWMHSTDSHSQRPKDEAGLHCADNTLWTILLHGNFLSTIYFLSSVWVIELKLHRCLDIAMTYLYTKDNILVIFIFWDHKFIFILSCGDFPLWRHRDVIENTFEMLIFQRIYFTHKTCWNFQPFRLQRLKSTFLLKLPVSPGRWGQIGVILFSFV